MALNFNSKHGIIIGVVTLLAGLWLMVSEVPKVYRYLTISDNSFKAFASEYIIHSVGFSIYAVFSIIFSILLIVGIIKKRHMLVAPWLFGGFLTAVADCCAPLYDLMTKPRFDVKDLFLLFIIIGVQVVILYPIKNLYEEIRKENSAVNNKVYEQISKKSIV